MKKLSDPLRSVDSRGGKKGATVGAHRYGGPEDRKNGSPWREPWVWRCIGFQAPEGRSESATVGLVFGKTQDVLPAPAFLIAPPGLLFFLGFVPTAHAVG
jgi:hypothetical protein